MVKHKNIQPVLYYKVNNVVENVVENVKKSHNITLFELFFEGFQPIVEKIPHNYVFNLCNLLIYYQLK